MTELAVSLMETHIELVLACLPAVSFMSLIRTSKHLYERYKDEVQAKRKESLVRFVDDYKMTAVDCEMHDHDTCRCFTKHNNYRYMYRGTKLPNGNTDGEVEYIDARNYRICVYSNGKRVGNELAYTKDRGCHLNANERIWRLNWRAYVLTEDFYSDFCNWKSIDISEMQLINKPNTSTNNSKGDRCGFWPDEGYFVNACYD